MTARRVSLVLFAALAVAGYLRTRQPILTWGATPAEAAGPLPGDALLAAADGISTRAIDIDAPPHDVWPWLAQMGPAPRGGAYTYDWIENLLGLDMHSVDNVLPEFQHPHVGDKIELGSNRMRLELVEPQRTLAWRSEDRNWGWTFVLADRAGRTRLISRNRFRLPSRAARIGMLPMEPASLVMERRMLREISACLKGSRGATRIAAAENEAKQRVNEQRALPQGAMRLARSATQGRSAPMHGRRQRGP